MGIFELLKSNKGTVSSVLGKELAQKVLDGDTDILTEAIQLAVYDCENTASKAIRAGAAKIIEKVAEKKPELVADKLELLKPAFEVKEPQTRWMMLQVFGYCAKINPLVAESVMRYARPFLKEKAGVCLSGSVHLYLGRIGATSECHANQVLPILDDAYQDALESEVDWILEAYINIVGLLCDEARLLVKNSAELQLAAKKKSTQNRAKKLLRKLNA